MFVISNYQLCMLYLRQSFALWFEKFYFTVLQHVLFTIYPPTCSIYYLDTILAPSQYLHSWYMCIIHVYNAQQTMCIFQILLFPPPLLNFQMLTKVGNVQLAVKKCISFILRNVNRYFNNKSAFHSLPRIDIFRQKVHFIH